VGIKKQWTQGVNWLMIYWKYPKV